MAELATPLSLTGYPKHLEHCWRLANGHTVTIRPIRPDDGPLEQDFVRSLSPKTRYYRFFNAIKELSPSMLDRLTHIDYRQQMTLVAVIREGASDTQVGAAEYVAEHGADTCEFAVVIHDAWQHIGLGTLLIESLMRCARAAGYARIEGEAMANNQPMLNLARALGFSVRMSADDARLVRVIKALTPVGTYSGPLLRATATPCGCY
jgi:acetyltransferase